MAGTNALDLQVICQELLDASVDALDTIPGFSPALAGAPERRFVSPGLPAFDCCDQLTVHVVNVTESPIPPPSTHKMSARKNIVNFNVTITRCHDIEIVPPLVETLEAAAEQHNADGWALWNYLWNLMRSGELFSLCGPVTWGGLRALTPSGGCGGWNLSLSGEVEGYENV